MTGSSRNSGGHPRGKKRGVKVYDGQRVPAGSELANQVAMKILPGWNVSDGLGQRHVCKGRKSLGYGSDEADCSVPGRY